MLWVEYLKSYCRACTPTNIYTTLLSWLAEEEFFCESWRLFLDDFALAADLNEIPTWRHKLSTSNNPRLFIKKFLDKDFFQWYYVHSQLPSYSPLIFLKDFSANPEEYSRLLEFAVKNDVLKTAGQSPGSMV